MSFKQAERMKEVPMSKLRAIFYECIELEDEGMEVTALTLENRISIRRSTSRKHAKRRWTGALQNTPITWGSRS